MSRLHQFPDIFLRDTRRAKRLAGNAVGGGFRGGAYDANVQIVPHVRLFDASFRERCAEHRKEIRGTAAVEIFLCIVARFEKSTVVPKDEDSGNVDDQGRLRHGLRVCGCRANVTNREIAEELDISVPTVERGIRVLKQAGIIVNWGHGWIETDADLAWRGDEAVRQAYSRVQEVHPRHPTLSFEVVQSAKVSSFE